MVFYQYPCTGVGHNKRTPAPLPPNTKLEFPGRRFFEVFLYYAHFFRVSTLCWGGGGVHILWPTPVQGFNKKNAKDHSTDRNKRNTKSGFTGSQFGERGDKITIPELDSA